MSKWISALWRVTVAALLIVALAGCFGKNASQDGVPAGFTLPEVEGKPDLVASYYLNDRDAWLFYVRKTDVEKPELWGYFTDDKGKNWTNAKFPTKKNWETEATKDNMIVNLPSSQTGMPGWLIINGPTNDGTTERALYRTMDKGTKWEFLGYLTNVLDGKINGITFISDKLGWITADYAGNTFVPIFRTINGGKTWENQVFAVLNGYKYGNVKPPVFDANNPMNGTLTVEFVGDGDKKAVVEYQTTDAGQTWKAKK